MRRVSNEAREMISELTEAIDAFSATLLIEANINAHQVARDKALAGAARKIIKLTKGRFRKQRSSILASSSLRKVHDALKRFTPAAREADRESTIAAEIAAALGPEVHGVPVTDSEQSIYHGAIAQAIDTGSARAAAQLVSTAGDTESFISEYLKDGGFTRLTGDVDTTTVKNLANAIADSYESGASFEGTVSAIRGVFSQASEYRARMIAQIELNDAYNQSLMHFADASGAEEKWWETDANPCAICIANELQGRIPIDEDFDSGDDAPTAHPFCQCSLGIGARLTT